MKSVKVSIVFIKPTPALLRCLWIALLYRGMHVTVCRMVEPYSDDVCIGRSVRV